MMRGWLTAFAAVLGVSEAACQKANHDDAPAAAREVPSASSAPSASVAAAAPSDVPSAVASAVPLPSASSIPAPIDSNAIAKLFMGTSTATPGTVGTITGGRFPGYVNPACGAVASNLRNEPIGTSQTATVNATFLSTPHDDDARVLAGARALLRSCANAGLRNDPNEAGHAVFSLTVAANGDISQIDIMANAGLSPATARCMQQRLRNLRLAATSASRPAQIRVETNHER